MTWGDKSPSGWCAVGQCGGSRGGGVVEMVVVGGEGMRGVSVGHRPRKVHVVVVAMARRGAAAKSSEEMPSGIVLLLLKVSALVSVVRML